MRAWKLKTGSALFGSVLNIKAGKKGSLLFETFVALMILSVGITSTLRVFGEALFAGRKTTEQAEAKLGMNHLLFSWFANPVSVPVSENGSLVLPLATHSQSDYWCDIKAKRLSVQSDESETDVRLLQNDGESD